MKVRYSYLTRQFAEPAAIFDEMRKLVATGDFTLGEPVAEFERRFAAMIGIKHAIGVGSGTDSLKLALKAANVGHGDEVITAANTFVATVGAINEIGAIPVLVDVDDSFCLAPDKLEAAITPRTRAIVPVHLTGNTCDMPAVMAIARGHGIAVVEDACQAILAEFDGKRAGTWGAAAGFSLHPLKNLNIWGDGGVVVTDDDVVAERLRLLRNHGLRDRDTVEVLGYNSRLDSLQAIVANWLIGSVHEITSQRVDNAAFYDRHFSQIPQIRVPPRRPIRKSVYHLYMVFAEERDTLLRYCVDRGIGAKIHYPIPLYQQKGLRHLGYEPGSFPITDQHAKSVISFPVDQHTTSAERRLVVETVEAFYRDR
ncbi:MAG TPA: DegT/DnrJ/EryC1/StrS family aminotransferase [Stellaceae bacterium]|nr:DegT/DnrJ/EryC1/StrS family aminotransferase [Stellaceae bacterium]